MACARCNASVPTKLYHYGPLPSADSKNKQFTDEELCESCRIAVGEVYDINGADKSDAAKSDDRDKKSEKPDAKDDKKPAPVTGEKKAQEADPGEIVRRGLVTPPSNSQGSPQAPRKA